MKKSLFGRALEQALMIRDLSRLGSKNPQARERAEALLAARMGRLRGLPQKLGQGLLLFSEEEKTSAYRGLADNAPQLPFELFVAELEKAWNKPWQQHLKELESQGRSASLGQVHQALLHSGQQVAVKVAYPGIREAVLNDLRLLGWLAAPAGLKFQAFSFADYQQVILRDLEDELDYSREARNQKDYAAAAADHPGIVIPAVHDELTTENSLVTTWEAGLPIEQVSLWPEPARFQIATNLVRHFLTMLFDHGLVHADPHPGNYAFRTSIQGPEILLYDYGSVARISKEKRLTLLRLIWSTSLGQGDALPLLVGLGFRQDLLQPLANRLPALCRVLFDPFLVPGKFDPATWERQKKIDQILGEDRWNFRFSGPPELTFVVRGFQGLFFYLKKLKVTISWFHLIQPLFNRYLADMLVLRLPRLEDQTASFSRMAQHLKIRVSQGGETRVALTFQLTALDNLEALMGDEVLARVRQQEIDLESIVSRARAAGLVPGELFSLKLPESSKTVRVWLA